MLKVSVVVPTYRPGDGLNRLVASVDAQTLPTDEFEVIFVDDGSPDNTLAQLNQVASTRPHVRVTQIENSGWPCRPRNVGTDMAQGEYVAYMDHDDELGPDALRAAWEFAYANHADVLTGKEARTHTAGWAIDTYREDLPQSVGREDRNPLVPMNPHKLYRRAFLNEHGIRFIEEGRVMWEDIFFNVAVQRHAKVISTLSSTPYYHWFATKGSGSSAFRRENPDYWKWMRRVIRATDEELSAAQPLAHRQLMGHHYRSRIIGSFDTKFAKRPRADRAMIFSECRTLQEAFDLTRFDHALNASGRLRAHLLRTDRIDLLTQLPGADMAVPGWGRAVSMRWDDTGVLHLRVDAEWSANGRRIALARDGDRILKVIPAAIAQAVPAALRDVTDEISGATLEIGMRERSSRFVWMLPSEGSIQTVDAPDGSVHLVGHVDATLDPSSAAGGRTLGASRWDLNVRAVLGGSASQQALRAATESTVALHQGRLLLAYVNDESRVTVVTEGAGIEALRRLTPDGARRDGNGGLVISLAGEHGGAGSVRIRIPSPDGKSIPATLHTADGRAHVRIPRPGRRLRLRIGDHAGDRPAHWEIGIRGDQVNLSPKLRQPVRPTRTARPLRVRVRRLGGDVLRKLGLRH